MTWNDRDLVFSTRTGAPLDAANVRREFRAACKAAKIGHDWTPRELRHSFVSLMSSSGVPVEEIARLAGHSSSRTTEERFKCPTRAAPMWIGESAVHQFRGQEPAEIVRVKLVARKPGAVRRAPRSGASACSPRWCPEMTSCFVPILRWNSNGMGGLLRRSFGS